MDGPLPDRMRRGRNVGKAFTTLMGGIGKLPFITVAKDWAKGINKPGLGWPFAIDNQLIFIAIDFCYVSLVFDGEVRELSPEELEIRGTTTCREAVKSGTRMGLSFIGAEGTLFPQAWASRINNRNILDGWLPFGLTMLGPAGFMAWSIHSSIRSIGQSRCCRTISPIEHQLQAAKKTMLHRLNETLLAIMSSDTWSQQTKIEEIQAAAADSDLPTLIRLLAASQGRGSESRESIIELLEPGGDVEILDREAPSGLCHRECTMTLTKGLCYFTGMVGIVGQFALFGILSYRGGEKVADYAGADDDGSKVAGGFAAATLMVSAAKLAYDGILKSALSLGVKTITFFRGDTSIHYYLSPNLTVGLKLIGVIMSALCWAPTDELAKQNSSGDLKQAVEAGAIIGVVLLAMSGVTAIVKVVVEKKVEIQGEEDKVRLLELSRRMGNVQRLLAESDLVEMARLLVDIGGPGSEMDMESQVQEFTIAQEQLEAYIESKNIRENRPLIIQDE